MATGATAPAPAASIEGQGSEEAIAKFSSKVDSTTALMGYMFFDLAPKRLHSSLGLIKLRYTLS